MQTDIHHKVALIGKKYIDTIISFDDAIILGETNKFSNINQTLGGIFNIIKLQHDNIQYITFECGIKKALILEEKKLSKRTSLTKDIKKAKKKKITIKDVDWIHISYIDDLEQEIITEEIFKNKISIDFCTNVDREIYKKYIDNSFVVFDSRERKELYKKIKTKTPIIFHDENGSECFIEGEIVYQHRINPIKNIKVNGAGDFFASFFIKEYLKFNNIEQANKNACKLTTQFLWETNEKNNIA